MQKTRRRTPKGLAASALRARPSSFQKTRFHLVESMPTIGMIKVATLAAFPIRVVSFWASRTGLRTLSKITALRDRDPTSFLVTAARAAELDAFQGWVSDACSRPHLQETLICQATHMTRSHGWFASPEPENWLVKHSSPYSKLRRMRSTFARPQ